MSPSCIYLDALDKAQPSYYWVYFHSLEEGEVRLVTCPRPPDRHECIEVGPDCGGVDTDAVVHSEPQLLGNVSLVWYLQIPTV